MHPAALSRRLSGLATRGVWLFMRQSSDKQKRRHKGSALVQRAQLRKVAHLGVRVTESNLTVIDALGESGSGEQDREKFRKLLEAARAGKIGILVLSNHDRLGRNEEDTAAVYAALRRSKSLVIVDGQIFDPNRASDFLPLKLYAQLAEFDNANRTRTFQLSRYELARRGGFRVALPTGLVWASPEDEDYVKAMTKQGLVAWLERFHADPGRYQARSIYDPAEDIAGAVRGKPKTYYPLPFPDAAVVRSCELQLRWLLETRSLRAVLERIGVPYQPTPTSPETQTPHPEWPVPGCMPRMRTHGAVWYPSMKPAWVDATRTSLFRWYQSPALYGIYGFHSTVDADDDPYDVADVDETSDDDDADGQLPRAGQSDAMWSPFPEAHDLQD